MGSAKVHMYNGERTAVLCTLLSEWLWNVLTTIGVEAKMVISGYGLKMCVQEPEKILRPFVCFLT